MESSSSLPPLSPPSAHRADLQTESKINCDWLLSLGLWGSFLRSEPAKKQWKRISKQQTNQQKRKMIASNQNDTQRFQLMRPGDKRNGTCYFTIQLYICAGAWENKFIIIFCFLRFFCAVIQHYFPSLSPNEDLLK